MITVVRKSHINSVTPMDVFTTLSDPQSLSQLLPRVRKSEILEEHENTARLVTYMSMGGFFGTIRCEGDLHWIEPHEIVFQVRNPLPLETRWTLSESINGTDIHVTMALDLKPLLGPMAQFVPTQAVAEMIGAELDQTLKAIAKRCSDLMAHEYAITA